jgi:hypothetical protein
MVLASAAAPAAISTATALVAVSATATISTTAAAISAAATTVSTTASISASAVTTGASTAAAAALGPGPCFIDHQGAIFYGFTVQSGNSRISFGFVRHFDKSKTL